MSNRFGLNIKSSVRDSKMSLAFKENEAQLPGVGGKRRPVTNTSGGESPGDIVEHVVIWSRLHWASRLVLGHAVPAVCDWEPG